MSTPIDRLPTEISQNRPIEDSAILSYNEILKNMEEPVQMTGEMPMEQGQYEPAPPVAQEQPQTHFIPPPMVNSRNKMYDLPPQPRPEPKRAPEPASPNWEQLQKEFIYIVVISVILNSESTQSLVRRLVPFAFQESHSSTVGLLINGLILAGVFLLAKNVTIGVKT